MKKTVGFVTIACVLFAALGTGYFYQSQQSKSGSISGETDAGILSNSPTEYSDVHDIGIPPKTGQSEIIRISQEEFSDITQEELTNYLSDRKECEQHDWHAIVVGEDTAILCAYDQEKFVYGTWDEDLGITETFAAQEEAADFCTMIRNLDS